MARRGWRRARLPGACRAWPACSSICSRAATRAWRATQCRAGWRRGGRGGVVGVGCGWCARRGPCRACCHQPRLTPLLGALRTHRDRAMVLAMLLGGLRRCEVLGLRLGDVNVGERRVHIRCGKGGRERIVPISSRFFVALGEYLELERSADAAREACFVVLKGPRRGLPLSAAGLDEVLAGARARAGLERCTCHHLRHTCLTRL